MPNWVTNIVTFSAKSIDDVQAIADFVKGDGVNRETDIDFDKIIHCPEPLLEVDAGGLQNESIEAYLSAARPDVKEVICGVEKISMTNFLNLKTSGRSKFRDWSFDCHMTKEQIEKAGEECYIPEEKKQELVKKGVTKAEYLVMVGKKYADNILNYGMPTWYEWCLENWNTKWNAADATFDVSNSTLFFSTAWSMPENIFIKLSEKFPHVPFVVEWADEDVGSNCGTAEFKGGKMESQYLPEYGSHEALELACQILDIDIDEFERECASENEE